MFLGGISFRVDNVGGTFAVPLFIFGALHSQWVIKTYPLHGGGFGGGYEEEAGIDQAILLLLEEAKS